MLLLLGEVFDAVAEKAADLVERVVLVAPVTEHRVLDASADLVDEVRGHAVVQSPPLTGRP